MTAVTADPLVGGRPPTDALPIIEEASGLVERVTWALADGWAVAKRNLTHVRYVPEKLLDVTLQPILFVLLFVYVFGNAINVPGGNYVEFLMAGIFVQTITFTSAGTAVSIADDLSKGVIDRFRSLPMARSAVLSGRTGADLIQSVLGVAVLAATGLLVGWRTHASVVAILGAFALMLLWGYAVSWLGTFVGLLVRTPDAAQTMLFMVAFPLTFLANTFVPIQGMPPVVQTIAEWNPVSAVVASCRELFGNAVPPTGPVPLPLQHPTVTAVLWSLALLLVFVPLAVRRYRKATAG
jgi:ABC transporter DrrB family efflux protein